ncbi:putative sulfate exporter family transporter [Bogoriella caseilytica]|uniref:Putative integral membrane protein (TIGR00698 family) n=1 Tax=Bogoriella caseilytica TaxID=56055 RepID=A0A3N2BAX7_9MICO|nr:putative sulfate exporter family transporter [Bogoriella caseilytica]ROR72348.1 putative integral membrane protein (TIGR00698 family) [Bogoriella caseilytica]
MTASLLRPWPPLLRAWPALLAAGAAVGLGLLAPLISPLLIALALGALCANTPAVRALSAVAPGAKTMLRLGVVLLGTRLTWEAAAALGWRGVVVAVVTTAAVFAVTCWVGDRLGLERGLVTLVAAGFAICGAAAIAAVESGIRRRDRDVALALAMVTIFGTVMILALPLAANALQLSDLQLGVWAGASIHEVAQVVAAASVAGTVALTSATTVKLLRVALLAPAVVAARWRDDRSQPAPDTAAAALSSPSAVPRRAPLLPWFVVGFLLAAVAASAGLVPDAARPAIDNAGLVLLAAGMFGLGLGIRVRDLLPVPWRVVALSSFSTAVAAGLALLLVLTLW